MLMVFLYGILMTHFGKICKRAVISFHLIAQTFIMITINTMLKVTHITWGVIARLHPTSIKPSQFKKTMKMRKKRHPSEKKPKMRRVRRMPLKMKMILRFRMFDSWKNMLKFSEVWLIRIILLVQIRVTTTYKIQMKFAHLRSTQI